jgi:hypothetical protein
MKVVINPLLYFSLSLLFLVTYSSPTPVHHFQSLYTKNRFNYDSCSHLNKTYEDPEEDRYSECLSYVDLIPSFDMTYLDRLAFEHRWAKKTCIETKISWWGENPEYFCGESWTVLVHSLVECLKNTERGWEVAKLCLCSPK